MKRINYLMVVVALFSLTMACKNLNYKKTKSGLVYKIFRGGGKDSLIKEGQVVKFHYAAKLNDSLMDQMNSYGKMPGYVRAKDVQNMQRPTYDFQELLTQMKKGDSIVTVQMADTLMIMQSRILPPNARKGDRVIMTVKIIDVFSVDSIAQADVNKEMERDKPRAMKEQEEQMAKMRKQQEEEQKKKMEEWEKSGEITKQLKAMEDYLASKKITAQKTGKGTYVHIDQQGTGPAAEPGKYITVKYTGKFLTDSVFESSTYSLTVGKGQVIQGWDEGLQLFKQGGKGTLYIPGFLAYGEAGGPGNTPFTPLKFDVEVQSVADKAPGQ